MLTALETPRTTWKETLVDVKPAPVKEEAAAVARPEPTREPTASQPSTAPTPAPTYLPTPAGENAVDNLCISLSHTPNEQVKMRVIENTIYPL